MRHVHVRAWLCLGLLIIAGFAMWLNVQAQPRPHPRFPGGSAVGVLLLHSRHPFCTASVVQSTAGNLLLTAAHCLGRKLASTLMFAPSYHGQDAPLGEWQVTGQVFPAGWFPHGNVNEDFAFLTVRGDVQARAGAERLGFSSPVPPWVRVEGYSLAGELTACSRKPGTIVAAGQQQLSFACSGYADASSGGPFLTGINGRSGLGTIVGIIGGYQDGGETPAVSYSSPFGAVLHNLYGSMTNANTGLSSFGAPLR